MKSLIISSNLDVLAGLGLAGIEGIYVKKENFLDEFKKNVSKKDIGIIILTEDDFNLISEEVIKVKLSKKLPLIVSIPSIGGLKDKDFIMRYVKESIGVNLN